MAITAKTFKKSLSAFVTSQKNQRDKLQALIMFGLEFYNGDIVEGESGDTGYLTAVLSSCIGVKSLPSNTIKEYIKEHANVKWGKSAKKDSDAIVFTKIGKEVAVTMPTETWYDYHAERNAVYTDYDETKGIKMLMTTIRKRIEEGRIKNESHGKAALAALASLDFLEA